MLIHKSDWQNKGSHHNRWKMTLKRGNMFYMHKTGHYSNQCDEEEIVQTSNKKEFSSINNEKMTAALMKNLKRNNRKWSRAEWVNQQQRQWRHFGRWGHCKQRQGIQQICLPAKWGQFVWIKSLPQYQRVGYYWIASWRITNPIKAIHKWLWQFTRWTTRMAPCCHNNRRYYVDQQNTIHNHNVMPDTLWNIRKD